mgnify:CR=1 FL=1
MIYPCIFLALWTLLVLLVLALSRVEKYGLRRFQPTSKPEPDFETRCTRHFSNLFEVPVLFYLACILIQVQNLQDKNLVTLGWIYCGFRVLHSMSHLLSSKVGPRLLLFVFSNVALVILWVKISRSLPWS